MNPTRTEETYLLSSFNYHLPPELIAQEPVHPRDSSRFMVCDLDGNEKCMDRGDGDLSGASNEIRHLRFHDLPNLLSSDDILMVNDSRVIPARVKGHKTTGGKSEVLFLSTDPEKGPLEALIKGRIREGAKIYPDTSGIRSEGSGERTRIRVVRHISEGRYEVEVRGVGGTLGTNEIMTFLEESGEMPVPPYIQKPLEEKEDYQTVYSREAGSVAAPTAGLHFTEDLLARLRKKGIRIVPVTLHVSIGTFLPVRDNDIRNHTMEPEYFQLGEEATELLSSEGGRGVMAGSGGGMGGGEVTAVGTTTVKTLESAFHGDVTRSSQEPFTGLRTEGWSNLFIYPGHEFRSPLKGMITNFHLPASTLIMLISAFAGRERVLRYYEEAVREQYRFYSFGDAMFLNGRPVIQE